MLTDEDRTAIDPREVYQDRLDSARITHQKSDRHERRLGDLRLVLFGAIALTAWLAWGSKALGPAWLALPLAGFAIVAVGFGRAADRRRRSSRLVEYYVRGLARLDGNWAGRGTPGERFRDPEHPYCDDLDLFGTGSLFERINAGRTADGQAVLADWLLTPAEMDEIRDRQAAVLELKSRLDLREDAALLGDEVGVEASFQGLEAWGAEPPALRVGPIRPISAILAIGAAIGLVGWLGLGWGPWPFLIVCGLEAAIHFPRRSKVEKVLEAVERRAGELGMLASFLERLEREPFQSKRLVDIREAIQRGGRPASGEVRALKNLVATLDARRNMMLGPISPFLLWGTQIAFAVEAWRARSGADVGGWLSAVGRFEALSSLAGYAFESPDDPFPELIDDGSARFEAVGLAHSLLPASVAVRNDLKLGDDLRLLVVSGSNMSGKSTLLRAVGVSAVLGLAGGPVRAHRLRIGPMAVGASLRAQDSLREGRSRFYAEILRLRTVLDLAQGPKPLLFLLDEVLAGTNSHDRRQGAEAVISGLVERGAIGLVTTHDLALAEIADRLDGRASNVHFADRLEGDVLEFDYTMREGVVRHSNALALMRSVGLDV